MNKIEKDINVTRYDIPVRIHYVQSTNLIPLIFHVKDYEIPSGSTARVYVKRPDGTAEYDNAVLNGNTVTVAVKKTMFSVAGDSRLQIRIAKGEDVLVSFEILVDVRKNHADGGMKSENITDIFDETLKDLDKAAKEAGIKAGEAEASARAAKASETNAANSATTAANSATSAAGSAAIATTKANEAEAFAREAKTSETKVKNSETAAKTSEINAAGSATEAANSATSAAGSAATATMKASEAVESAENAQESETNAAASAELAENHALTSKSYAVGTGNVVRPSDETDNSRFYSELAQRLTEEARKLLDQAQKIVSAATAGSLIPAGTITFAELPEEPKVGYMYNISDDFMTDTRFAEGPGVFYRAGANVYWSKEGQWDVMVGVQVTGVKGEAESEYRFGNVNITKANMGLANAEDTADADKRVANAATLKDGGDGKDITAAYSKAGLDASNWLAAWNGYELRAISPGNIAPAFTQAAARENLTTKEKIGIALGKISKWFADLKTVAFTGSYTDLSNQPQSLKNPNALTFTGAVTGSYDGSVAKSVAIPSAGNGTVTIKQAGASKGSFTMNQSGNTTIELTDSNTTYGVATTSAAGLMSAADKVKLNGIAAGAQVNPTSLPANGGTSSYTNYVNANNIPANANLNSYTTPGFYYCPANATVATFTNCPTKNAFFMIVGRHAGTYQEVIEYMTTSPKRYMRNYYNNAWGSWYRVYTTADAPPDTNTTYGNMKGATTSSAGAAGLAPAPAAGAANRYLRSDGTWQVPPDNNTVYTHPTTAGNKHIPAGGAAGQFLKWSAAGTAVWASLVNNLLATVAGNPLDATQGKVLDDKITALNGNLSSGYTHLTENSNGFLVLPNGFKLVYGTYPASSLVSDAVVGGYSTKYGLKTPLFANATPRYSGGFPRVAIHSIASDSIKIGCDVNFSNCFIQWMVIG